MNVAIIGLGLIGGSAALDLRQSGFAKSVYGVDESETHRTEALARRLVDRIVSLAEACQAADLIILAIPVDAIERLLPEVLSQIRLGAVVTDMGSTKERICEAVSSHPSRSSYVASHPMAGTEFSGPGAALSGLFRGKAAVICDREISTPEALSCVESMYAALGMRIISMSSANHDLHAAYISHLSHISSFVLASTVLDKERDVNAIFDLASGGFESTVRLAKSSPEMWTPIFRHNRDQVADALAAYIARLQAFHLALVDGRFEEIFGSMQEANGIRRVLSRMKSNSDEARK